MRYYAIKLSYGAEYGKGSIEKKNTEKERATVRGVKPEKTSAAGEGAESEKEYIKKETTRCQRQKIMEVETVYGGFVAGAGFGVVCRPLCLLLLQDAAGFSKAVYVERQAGVKILAADGREITSYGALFAEPVDVDDLPPYVYQAVIDTEDRRFFKHGGFDYIGFARAMAVNIAKMRYAQGASTITQQVAKNLFLTREKSIRRKVQEYLLAQWLEKHFSKKQILNIYLNRVFSATARTG